LYLKEKKIIHVCYDAARGKIPLREFGFHLSILIPSFSHMYLCSNQGVRNETQKQLQLRINVTLFHHDNNNTKTNGFIDIIIIMEGV
jgi:hypothetical protein